VLGVELPGSARRFIGDRDPAWVENALYSPGDLTWEWEIEPEFAGGLLQASGKMIFDDHVEGTLRVVAGDLSFRVPIFGTRVEEVVVDHLDKVYDAEAHHLAGWLDPG
jgi:hypothetical protein